MSVAGSDVIVVGGGTAGAALAARLVTAGASVVLVEAGPDYGPLGGGAWPVDLLDATTLPTSHDWGLSGPAADGRSLALDRAKVVGGCSAHNGSTMSVGWRADWDLLPPGWRADEIEPALSRAAVATKVRVPGDDEIQPFQQAFVEACGTVGLDRTDDLLDPDGELGVSVSPVNIVDGVRWNTALAYLDPVRSSQRLRIVPDGLADRVAISGGRVAGVHVIVDGRSRFIAGDRVVLSAGAYGTPPILQRSGIGDPVQLAALGIEPVVEQPRVGHDLQDHPVVRLEFAATAELVSALETFRAGTGFLPEEQCVAKLASSPSIEAPYDLHVFPWVEPDARRGWRCVVAIGLLRPRSDGTIEIRSADPTESPRIDHRYLSHPDDVERLVDALGQVGALVAAEPLASMLGTPLLVPPSRAPRRQLEEWVRTSHSHYWHPTGGASLGVANGDATVCDARAGVRGVEGLVVADASLLPFVPRCTPALPITAIGERVASIIGS